MNDLQFIEQRVRCVSIYIINLLKLMKMQIKMRMICQICFNHAEETV